MISREDVAQAIERAHWPQSVGSHERALWIADAILALTHLEVASMPVQRDERAEKLGERLDAAERQLAQELANLSATAERCRVLEERARKAEAEGAVNDTLLADRQRILDALPCPTHGPCVPHVLEWIERARNAEALAANLRRVDNERAIELMRVKRALTSATEGDAVGRLVKAVDAYTDYPSNRWGVGMTKLLDALNDPALAAWRRK